MTDHTPLLNKLQIKKNNAGAMFGMNCSSTTTDAGRFASINPTNKQAIAHVYNGSSQDYETVIGHAQAAYLHWQTVPAPKRGQLIRDLGLLIQQHQDSLAQLISLEMGKTLPESVGEVQEAIDMAAYAVGQSRMLHGLCMHSERESHRMYEQWHPLGVVGVITAFNFPIAVWAWNAMLAVICGNPVVWKPSSKTPLCAIAMQHLCNQVMEQHHVNSIFSLLISEDLHIAEQLVADTRIALISFTGSTKVGLAVNETVAKRMGRCLLECSGNNAMIVDETADLSLAATAIAFAAIGTTGQRCTSLRRLIVHHKIVTPLIKQLQTLYAKLSIGDPLNPNIDMGPLIDKSAVDTFVQTIAIIKKYGGKIITGGDVINNEGYFVTPTIVTAKNDWDIVQQETFAPILYVLTYENLKDAIALHNQSAHGLSSAMFTQHLKHAELFLSACGSDCGIVNINMGTSGAEIGGAFGGEKLTGGGREAGSDSWKHYMRRQTVTINWGDKLPLAQGIQFGKKTSKM